MGTPLTIDERDSLKNDLFDFQLADAANVYFDAVNTVIDELKEKRDEAEDDAKSLRDFLIDSAACFVPFGPVLKKMASSSLGQAIAGKFTDSDFAKSAVADASKSFVSFMTKEKVFKASEEAHWEMLKNFALELKEGFRKRLWRTYLFLKENIGDPKKLPDSLLFAIHQKYHVENFTLRIVQEMISEQLRALDFFVFAPFGAGVPILGDNEYELYPKIVPARWTPSRINGRFMLNMVEMKEYNTAEIQVFLPIMTLHRIYSNPHSSGNRGISRMRPICRVVPPSLIPLTLSNAREKGILLELHDGLATLEKSGFGEPKYKLELNLNNHKDSLLYRQAGYLQYFYSGYKLLNSEGL